MYLDIGRRLRETNKNMYKGCSLERLYKLLNELGYEEVPEPYLW